jgi:HD-GYP domain-containing protein (c-di-GMP phosphodiesterase class II)
VNPSLVAVPAPAPVRPEELAGVEMFGGMGPDALRDLAAGASRRTYAPGQVVFNEGDAGRSMHVVTRGLLKVIRPTLDPGLVLARLERGSPFGELAVLNSQPRLASVIAIDDSETVEIEGDALDRVFDDHPGAVRRMLGVLARDLTLMKEELAQRNDKLEDQVRERTADLRETQLEVVRRLGRAAESRDYETGLHITRMSRIAARLARAAGLTAERCELVLHAAPMHDVGKIGIPDSILLKPGPLGAEEWELMKRHTTIGADLLSGSESPVVQLAEVIALTHHERWDGSGYPKGLSGDDIPIEGRICAIADVVDALVSDRPYKRAWPIADALDEIASQQGRQFDPRLVRLFIGMRAEIEDLLRSTGSTSHLSPRGS